jgi:secreted protein with Ig-like and vWFA domain
LLEEFSVDERIPANAINRRPPINSAIPPIIIKMAMIVTPSGLFVFVFEFKFISKSY